MVIPGDTSSQRYLGNSEGAPPTPPPGGYRGARRAQIPVAAPHMTRDLAKREVDEKGRTKRAWVGIAALVIAALFVGVLLIVLNVGGSHVLYGLNMVAVQLAVLAVVLIALITPGARAWGAAALAVCLVANVATIGASGALNSAATGNYENIKTDDQKFWEKFPGVKAEDTDELLRLPSFEDITASADSVIDPVKSDLTSAFGITWATPALEMKRPMRNGYGGESWFFTYTSEKWMSNEAIHSTKDKTAVVNAINKVLADKGLESLYSLSEPGYRDDAVLEQLYGSADPDTQVIWEMYTSSWDENISVYVQFVDLSNDNADGTFRTDREDWFKRTGEPLEGVSIYVVSGPTLSEADRPAFEDLIAEY